MEYYLKRLIIITFLPAGDRFGQMLTQTFARGTSAAITMYDVTSRASFNNLKQWIECLTATLGHEVPMVIAGNKIDLAKNKEISSGESQKFADSQGIPLVEISVKDTTNIAELAKLVSINMLLKNPNSTCLKGMPAMETQSHLI